MIFAKDLRKKEKEELLAQYEKLKKELREASVAVINKKEKTAGRPRDIRKSIAKILTVIKEKQILESRKK